ncbi:hypothetical protein KIPB_012416, partial [Kipferlia bialata]|eukprot:g12416.t1
MSGSDFTARMPIPLGHPSFPHTHTHPREREREREGQRAHPGAAQPQGSQGGGRVEAHTRQVGQLQEGEMYTHETVSQRQRQRERLEVERARLAAQRLERDRARQMQGVHTQQMKTQ